MKTASGKDKQGECTIIQHIGGVIWSTEKDLAEGRKKLLKKHQGQPILSGWLPNKSTALSLLCNQVYYVIVTCI